MQLFADVLKKRIILHSKDSIAKFSMFEPKTSEKVGDMHIVRDDTNNEFQAMLVQIGEKKILDHEKLASLIEKHPFLQD